MKISVVIITLLTVASSVFAASPEYTKYMDKYAAERVNDLKVTGVALVCVHGESENFSYVLQLISKEVAVHGSQPTVNGNGSAWNPYQYCVTLNRR